MTASYHRLENLGHENHVDRLSEQGDGQVQNVKAARVYVFGETDVAEDEYELNTNSSLEMSAVRARGKVKQQLQAATKVDNEEVIIEQKITEGDTVRSIALKFGCQVSELKRINNLIRDQDFFALTHVKVPIKRHGLLSELLEEENKNGDHSAREGASNCLSDSVMDVTEANEEEGEDGDDTQELLVRTLSIRGALSNQGKEAENFLQKMDKDLKSIVESTKNRKDTLEEVTQTLTCRRIYPLQRQQSWLSGVDCGMRWWNLIVAIVVVGILLPTVYVVYFKFVKPDR